jgi:hypothetical protein
VGDLSVVPKGAEQISKSRLLILIRTQTSLKNAELYYTKKPYSCSQEAMPTFTENHKIFLPHLHLDLPGIPIHVKL